MLPASYQKFAHRVYVGALSGVAATLPLSLRWNSIFIIVAGASAVLSFVLVKNKLSFNKLSLSFLCLYVGAIVGVINSTNSKIAYFDLEQKLPWLVLPLIFLFGGKLEKNEFRLILITFLIAISCVNGYALAAPESFINQLSMTWHTWSDSLRVDRIYLGMYNVFGLAIVYYLLLSSTGVFEKIVYATVFLVLMVSLFNTFAKTAIAIFLTLVALEFAYLLYKAGKKLFYSGVFIAIAVAIMVLVTNNPISHVTNKILKKETFDFSNKPLLFESINFRYLTWESSWSILKEDNNWMIGVGTGDSQELLVERYQLKLNEYDRYIHATSYNSHNQYFTTWLNFGFVFLLIMVFQFLYSMSLYYRSGSRIGIYFILIIMISCITESLFERQQGIVFYTLFELLLLSTIDHKRVPAS